MKTNATKFFLGWPAFALVALAAYQLLSSPLQNLPLWFEAGKSGEFIARCPGAEFSVSGTSARFDLMKSDGTTASCTMKFQGASAGCKSYGLQPLAGKINRFTGSTPLDWQRDIQSFASVKIPSVYPGIDAVFYGNQELLEYDFNLAAGADPRQIVLSFEGAQKVSIAKDGSLVVKLNGGKVIQHPPIAYQTINGQRQNIEIRYQLLTQETVGFAVGNYNSKLPLIIDPVLLFSTYFGGRYGDMPWAIAVSPVDNSIYVAGQTFSPYVSNTIPMASSLAFQTNYAGGKISGDAFVLRFDSTGTNLIFATYLGGTDNDGAFGIAVDGSGNAYIAGYTDSTNFPTTNALYSQINSLPVKQFKSSRSTDAFVTELNPAGDALIYSTYFGGNSMDAACSIALDGANNAYITGYTYSTNFPVTPGAFQSTLQCSNTVYFNANAFVSVLSSGGSNLSYSTYLGGTNFDVAKSIAYNNNRVFVAGFTFSTNFPNINHLAGFDVLNGDTRTNRQKDRFGTPSDAFVTAFDASSPTLSLMYSTLLGGTNNDAANSIAADAAGNAFVAGYTMSTNFPYTTTNVPDLTPAFVHTNDFKKHFRLATNGFLTQIKWDGSSPSIGYSAMFGGLGVNVANGVALDAAGNAYVIASASCTNWPVTTNVIYPPLSATNSSKKKYGERMSDAAIIVFNQDATALLYSAYLGGRESDYGNAIALDSDGNACITGYTTSTNFPMVNPWKSYRTGSNDMFVAKISAYNVVPLLARPAARTINPKATRTAGFNLPEEIQLRWQLPVAGGRLESASDLSRTNWQPVPGSPVFTNGWFELNRPATNAVEFFRVGRP